MLPSVQTITTDTDFPDKTGVVIIGGGIIGVSAAFYLAKAKVPVVLFEKGEIAHEQSGRNQGWVRNTNRDPREIPLAIESLRMWRSLNEVVGGETGFRQCGIVFAAESEETLATREEWLKLAKDYQVDSRIVSGAELSKLLPGLGRPIKAALYSPSDGRAEPQLAAPAIARAAQALGARIFTQCAVLNVERAGGRITGVVTERGRVACDSAVLAGGAWSSLFANDLGLRLPQLKVRSSVMRVSGALGGPEVNLSTSNLLIRKRLDGDYTVANSENHAADVVPDSFRYFKEFLPILRRRWADLPLRFGGEFFRELGYKKKAFEAGQSPYETMRILDPKPRARQSLKAKAALDSTFPVFKGAPVKQHWAGFVDVTPDEIPVISPVQEVPGFYVATGFSGHGFGIGPGAGRLVADLVTGGQPIVDPTPFRFDRFTDGGLERMPNYRK